MNFPPTQIPPQAGEVVVGCGHASRSPYAREMPDPRNGWEWFEVEPPVFCVDPSGGDNIAARWIATCSACLKSAAGDPRRIDIREHWRITGVPQDHHTALAGLAASGDRDGLRAYLEQLEPPDLAECAIRLRRGM